MPIEVTSLRDRRSFSVRSIRRHFHSLLASLVLTKNSLLFRPIIALLLTGMVAAGATLLRSYKYYSRIVEARLESGYLTSRPGLYAAPRTIRVGQGFSPDDLVVALRRAGYVQESGSDVWSGSFQRQENAIEICPSHAHQVTGPLTVRVNFDKDRISELTTDGVSLDSFTLEPEALTNDVSSKTGRRNTLAYSDIPANLIHAILSTEDRRFFDHPGVDFFGILRALLRNAGDEHIGQGGSTITQQLVKNTYLSPERTFRRKYAEAMLAVALERRLSKQDIFALYCNEVYLGQRGAVGIRGVEEAARHYFGKQLGELSLAEAATIAGMIQGPARYSPERHAEAAVTRRSTVLAAMARDGWITATEASVAANEPIRVTVLPNTHSSIAPYFVDYVNRVAESDLETSPESQRIYTTIDLDLQRLAETAIDHQLERLAASGRNGDAKNGDAKPQAALVALDPRTGNVLAMVGGRDYAESQLNRATDARRQPGSTFKPFVYAAALEDGMSPVQMFSDSPREFIYDHNRVYRPANFGGGYSMRDVMMRTGLVRSLNVVTVDVATQTGLSRVANLASRFGLPKPERFPSLALGTTEATPLQMAAAYAAFANGGRHVEPKVIASVAEPPGSHTLAGAADQVISPTTAYMITNMLSDVVDHGTARASRAVLKATAVAGKTGTSRDGWFVGYTPNLVCAVWIGFDDNRQLGLTGAQAALPAWTEFIKEAVELRPELGRRNFECPEGIKFVEIDSDTGLLSTLSCSARELIAVTDRLAPNAECSKHGNLPVMGEQGEEEAEPTEATAAVAHQTKKPSERNFLSMEIGNPKSTRVDIDQRGRRTLVNDMR